MRVATDVLQRFIDVPSDRAVLRDLLDDTGLEVKRVEDDGPHAVFTLELLANRGDHHCYDGVATELDGRLGSGTRRPEATELSVGDSPWPVELQTDLCLQYTVTLLERQGDAQPLAAPALRVLEAAGLNSVSGPVDATNLSNLELGQPTHAFDADTLDGPIVIRRSVVGEMAWPLFTESRVEVPEGTLVIADRSKILAIAGVIGCEESKATGTTRRLLLESATFDPVAVRIASRALGIHTDSSVRFERGADPERPLLGAARVVHLLEAAGWQRRGDTGAVGAWRNPGRVVSLDAVRANAFLHTELSPAEMAQRLTRYGFRVRVDGAMIHASVPTWRLWDVEFVADLYEELAKSIGYNATPIALPPVGLGAVASPPEVRKRLAEDVLMGCGFYEVFTDGFYGRQLLAQLDLPAGHPLERHLETQNALDRAYTLLKNNGLLQAIEAVAVNERRRTNDVKLFEWTRTFHPIDELLPRPAVRTRPPVVERPLLWAVATGLDRSKAWDDTSRPADLWFMKGVLRELGVCLGLDFEIITLSNAHPLASSLHPGRRAAIHLNGDPVGVIGEVHPAVCRRFKLKLARPVYLEIGADSVRSEGVRPPFVEPPRTQAIVRNLAFSLPRGVEATDVAAWLHASGPEWLRRVRIQDLFELEGGVRSITFELSYANPHAERTAEQVNAATEALVTAVHEHFGPRGVALR